MGLKLEEILNKNDISSMCNSFSKMTDTSLSIYDVFGEFFVEENEQAYKDAFDIFDPLQYKDLEPELLIPNMIETFPKIQIQEFLGGILKAIVPFEVDGATVGSVHFGPLLLESSSFASDVGNDSAISKKLPIYNLALFQGTMEFLCHFVKSIGNLGDLAYKKRKSEDLLKKIGDNAPGVLYKYHLSPTGEIYFSHISTRIQEFSRYTPEEIYKDAGKTFECVHPDDVQPFINSVAESARNLTPWNFEYRSVIDENNVRTHLGRSVPELEPDGTVVWHGYLSDITEQKKIEQALKDEKERYKAVSEAIPGAVYRCTSDGVLELMSAGIESLSGYPATDFVNNRVRSYRSIMNIEDSQTVRSAFYEAIEHKDRFYYSEYRIRTKSGQVKWIHDSVRILYDEKNELKGHEGVLLEVTKQKQATMDLKLFKTISDLSVQGNVITDLEGRITYVNSFFANIHGYSIDELLGENESIFYAKNQASPLIRLMDPRNDESDFGPIELWHQCKNGIPIPMMVSGVIITDFKNIPRYISTTAIDITQRKEIELQLQQSQKMESIGTLAGGIAHDFNNILFPILSCAEMLKEEVPDDEILLEHVDEIYTSAIRARDLVKQILTFSRHEDHQATILGIQPILKETLKLIRSSIPSSIEISSKIDMKCKPIKADPIQIHQLLMNILTNAYQSIESRVGKLGVSLNSSQINPDDWGSPHLVPGEYNCIAISDTGKGMDEETLVRVFEPFFTTKDKGQGTGLGLSVVHGIVESLNGFIHVSSENGVGTFVQVFLPSVDELIVPAAVLEDVEFNGGDEHILIVDDEKTILRIEEKILMNIGYKVTAFNSSTEALVHFKSFPDIYDLVISDMTMPGMLGDKLAVEILKIRPEIPIIICSGYSENANKEQVASIGVNGFVTKPLLINEFTSEVRSVLDGKSGSDNSSSKN